MFIRKQQPETAPRTAASSRAAGGSSSSDNRTTTHTGYMAELDEWLDFTIFEPIQNAIAGGDAKTLHIAFIESKQLLKRKVLASYHNGLQTKQSSNPKNNGQPTHRRN